MESTSSYIFPLVVNLVRYFVLAGIPFLIFYWFFPRFFSLNKIQEKLAKRSDFYREIGNSLLTNLILVGVALAILKTPLRDSTQFYGDLHAHPVWWIFVSVGLSLIIHDTYFYWMHRTIHHPRLFKAFHLTHHKSTNPSPWASYSFHFLEAFLEALIIPILLFVLPLHVYALLLFGTASFLINVYGHLGYEIMPKWFYRSWLFEVLNSSVHHNLHHEKFEGNYGLYFRVWDRVMGTEHPEYEQRYRAIQEQRFG
ncbi:MAG: sterol desaturase family protein [Bacteroidota bacterium]